MCDDRTIVRPCCRERLQQPLEMDALPRIGAVERLVENEYFGIVHERRRETHPLPHAARIRLHRAVLRVGEIDERDRAIDRGIEILDAAETAPSSARTRAPS